MARDRVERLTSATFGSEPWGPPDRSLKGFRSNSDRPGLRMAVGLELPELAAARE